MQVRELAGYRLLAEIGSGGMGTVHRAEVIAPTGELSAGRIVAIKLIHPHLAAEPGYLERFRREAEIGRRIRHANVVRTLDAGEATTAEGARHFLVMEHVEGQTLRALLSEMGRVPEGLCRHIAREVAEALGAMHGQGVVHRDLKPENVLITVDERVKVMDLGVARIQDAATRLSLTGAFLGSLEYAAPEQLRGGASNVDGRVDLYALGLVLYELASARHPFRGAAPAAVIRRIVEETPRRLGEENPQLSAFFEQVVHALLEKDPAKRIPSATVLVEILKQAESGSWWRDEIRSMHSRTRRPLRRIRIPRETRLHGRDDELATLERLYEDASAGKGRVLLLEGEPGVGKSRLVDEFVARLWERGASPYFLHGAYPLGGGGIEGGALIAAYREHLGTGGLETALRRYLPTTPILVPSFAALLRGDLPPDGSRSLSSDALQTVFVNLTQALAAEQPLVLLIDDLHRAGPESRAVFATLAHAVAEHRVLLVGAFEQGALTDWKAEISRVPHARTMVLPRLDAKAMSDLLGEALGSERLAHELSRSLAKQTDGNPFFLFEVLDMLREEGTLAVGADGSWTLAGKLQRGRIPSSVVQLVQARVGRLDRDERDLLEAAACLGTEFDPLLAGQVLGWEALPTLRMFAHIEREHRLVRSAGRLVRFDHPTVCDALYENLGATLRDEMHARIADLLEQRASAAGPTPPALVEAIFEHALRGHRHALARKHKDVALQQLAAAHLRGKAVELAEHCLTEEGLLDVRERIRVLLFAQVLLGHVGRSHRRLEMTGEALALARGLDDARLEAEALSAHGLGLWSVGRLTESLETFERALDLARADGNEERTALVLSQLGIVLQAMGRNDEAEPRFREYLERSERDGFQEGQAGALTNLGLIALARGRLAEAQDFFERSYALAGACGARTWQANAASNLGGVFFVQGKWEDCRRQVARNLEISREIGHRRGEAVSEGGLGLLAFSSGRYAEALRHHEDAIRLFREMGDPSGEALALGNLACVQRALGRFEEALGSSARQAALAEEAQDRRGVAAAQLGRGQALLLMDRAEDARSQLRQAVATYVDLDRPRDTTLCRLALGRAALALGARQDAAEELTTALEQASRIGIPNVCVMTVLLLACHGLAPPAEAAEVTDDQIARLEKDEALEARFLQYRLTGDPVRLAQARRILDDLVLNAPVQDRESMRTTVPLYREVASAPG